MLNLLKYEMRKTRGAKLILLGLTAVLEAFFLFGVVTKNENYGNIGVLLLALIAAVGIVFIGIHSIVTLHHDMNTKQSYMLFMLPHNNYEILGAKAIECTISVAIASIFYFVLGVIDIQIFIGGFNIQTLIDFSQELLAMIGLELGLDIGNIASFFTSAAASWIETVMVAFFAVILASSLLRGKKFSGLVSFLFFILISAFFSHLVELLPDAGSFIANNLISAGVMMVISFLVYAASALLMEKKLSV